MFLLKTIDKNSHFIYQGFSQDYLSLNILANIQQELPYIYEFADNGLLLLNQNGLLLEVEYIFAKIAQFKDYPDIKTNNIDHGIPLFEVSQQAYFETNPSIFVQQESKNILIFFNEEQKDVDQIIQQGNVSFLFHQKKCLGIETKECIFDIDQKQQDIWLLQNHILT